MPSPPAFLQTLLRQDDTCVDRCISNWKIGFAVLLFFEGFVFGHIIYLIKRLTASSSRRFTYAFHLGHALSGGVFFAAGVLHILPEAIALISGEHGEDEHHDDLEERMSMLRQVEDDLEEPEEEHSEGFPWAFLILILAVYFFFFIENILLPKLLSSKKIAPAQFDEETGTPSTATFAQNDHSDESDSQIQAKGFKSREFVIGIIEILGLSAHSMFESIALGLSGSFSTVLNIFIATVAHRWATTSAIGFKLLKNLSYLPFFTLILLFSAIAPVGIGIGAALGNLSETVQGVLFSISAGTFIYIGVFEVMAEEFVEHRQWPVMKFVMTMIGASIIIVVTVILNVLDIHG